MREFGRLARHLKPDWILIENVPGLANVPGFSTFRRFRKVLADLKYSIASGVIDAKAFGVPQTRRCFVMIGAKRVEPTLPNPTHGPDKLAYATVTRGDFRLSGASGWPRTRRGRQSLGRGRLRTEPHSDSQHPERMAADAWTGPRTFSLIATAITKATPMCTVG